MKHHQLLAINYIVFALFILFFLYDASFMLGQLLTGSVSIPMLPNDPNYIPNTEAIIFESEPAYPYFHQLNRTLLKPINVILDNNWILLIMFLISMPLLYIASLTLAIINLGKKQSQYTRLALISIITILASLLLIPMFLTQIAKLA